MHTSPPRFGALVLALLLGASFGSRHGPAGILGNAAAQTPDVSPAPTAANPAEPPAVSLPPPTSGQPLPAAPAHPDANGRHLAPRDTFYLLTYVSVRTDKGVEGFEPGQEVRLVEVHRATHTLVVTDGHAQVEVSPSQLTHDVDVAAMVRQKDQAAQAQVAAYVQAEHAAYQKYEREAADATAKDLALRRQEQAAAQAAAGQTSAPEQTPTPDPTTQVDSTPVDNAAYYDNGGYGYGSPYVYFVNPRPERRVQAPVAAPVVALPGKIEVQTGHVGAGRPK